MTDSLPLIRPRVDARELVGGITILLEEQKRALKTLAESLAHACTSKDGASPLFLDALGNLVSTARPVTSNLLQDGQRFLTDLRDRPLLIDRLVRSAQDHPSAGGYLRRRFFSALSDLLTSVAPRNDLEFTIEIANSLGTVPTTRIAAAPSFRLVFESVSVGQLVNHTLDISKVIDREIFALKVAYIVLVVGLVGGAAYLFFSRD